MLPEVSAYFIAAAGAWFAAQGIKYYLSRNARTGKRNNAAWYLSGNMPSAHSATMVALATVVGVMDGLDSGLFAVTAVIAVITMYDSLMARRAAGEQGLALKKLIELSPFSKDPLPHHALGHRPIEVLAGAGLGLAIGFIVAFLIT